MSYELKMRVWRGNEASGEVISVGPGVTNFHPGDRVAYYINLGAYATERNVPANKLVKLPDHITQDGQIVRHLARIERRKFRRPPRKVQGM